MHYSIKSGLFAVTVSAFLYGISFLYAPFSSAAVIFLIPLLLCIEKKISIGILTGALWSIIAFFMHAFGILYVVVNYGTNVAIVTCVLFFFGLYCGLYSMIWIWLLQKKMNSQPLLQIVYRVLVTVLFFVAIDRFFLFPLGVIQGYPLFFPLIPLINTLAGVIFIATIQRWLFLIMVVIMQELIVYSIVHSQFSRTKISIFIICFTTIFLFPPHCLFLTQKQLIEKYDTDSIACIVECKTEKNPQDHAQLLYSLMVKARQLYPQAKTFIMRESAFPFSLNEHRYAIEMWQKNIMKEGDHIVFGSLWCENDACFNCFFCINECRIMHRYEKTHLIPLFEYIPESLFFKSKLRNLFFQKKDLFSQGFSTSVPLKINDNTLILPVICSELFWNKRSKHLHTQCPLLCLMHDGHFANSGYDALMILMARYKACYEQRTIIYCSYFHALLIGTHGESCKLNKISAQ